MQESNIGLWYKIQLTASFSSSIINAHVFSSCKGVTHVTKIQEKSAHVSYT